MQGATVAHDGRPMVVFTKQEYRTTDPAALITPSGLWPRGGAGASGVGAEEEDGKRLRTRVYSLPELY